jgi:hypothetical protein
MTNTISLIKEIDNPSIATRPKSQRLKPRRQRRQEMRDRDRAAKLNAK